MPFKKLLIIPFLLLLIACGGHEERNQSDSKPASFKTYPINVNAPRISLSRLVESIEVIGLEETDSSLLSYANQVALFEDKFVFLSGRNGAVFIYDDKGKFINKFAHKGDGPGEYSSLKNFWMKEDTIVVFDANKSSLLYYNLEGNHQKTVRFNEQPSHIVDYKGHYFMEMSFQIIQDSLRYRLLIENKQQEQVGLHLPYPKELPFPVYSNVNSFKPLGDEMFFQPTFHDTVYQVSNEGAIPAFHLDFGEDYFWNDETLFDNPSGVMSLIGERNQVWIFNTFIGKEKNIINFNTSFKDFYQGILDKETGAYQRMDLRRTQEARFTFIVVLSKGDRFLFSLPSTELADFIEEVGEEKVNFRADWDLDRIESSENPLLMWVKFK